MNPTDGEAFEAELARIRRALTSNEPPGDRSFVVVPQEGTTYVTGTTLPALSSGSFTQTAAGGIVRPSPTRTGTAPYIAAFLVHSDYLDQNISDVLLQGLLKAMSVHAPPEELIATLCTANLCAGDREDLLDQLVSEYSSLLIPSTAAKLRNALSGTDPPRRFLARQAVLKALRLALLAEATDPPVPMNPLAKAIVMAHGIAQTLDLMPAGGGTPFSPGISAELAVSIAQNYLFHRHQDVYMRIQRADELWGVYGQEVARSALGRSADALFSEATGGMDRRDVFAIGFGIYLHATQWKPGQPFALQLPTLASGDQAKTDRVLDFLSAPRDALVAKLRAADAAWDLEPFEESPVLRIPAGLLVIDLPLLLNRITSCLADVVYESFLQRGRQKDAHVWSMEYGRMVERMAIAYARRLAPTVLGGGQTFFTEDAMKAVMSAQRVCEAVIDYGDSLLLLEVQKGEVQAEVRYQGDVSRFLKHIEDAIVSKAEQLDSVARFVLHDDRALTGMPTIREPKPMIFPVVVQGDGFAVEPISQRYIRDEVRKRGWLSHPRIATLSVIDADELQTLVGLAESRSYTPARLLTEWHSSDRDLYSLRNFLLHAYPDAWPHDVRPRGAKAIGEALTGDVISRLGITRFNPPDPARSDSEI